MRKMTRTKKIMKHTQDCRYNTYGTIYDDTEINTEDKRDTDDTNYTYNEDKGMAIETIMPHTIKIMKTNRMVELKRRHKL